MLLNMKTNFKSKYLGLILYMESKNEDERRRNFISVGLRKGNIVYRYDMGNGPGEFSL